MTVKSSASTLREKFLSLSLIIAWLSGCFPVQSPLQSSANFEFKRGFRFRKLTSYFSTFLTTIAALDYFTSDYESGAGRAVSELIMGFGILTVYFCTDITIRIISLNVCPVIVSVLKMTNKLSKPSKLPKKTPKVFILIVVTQIVYIIQKIAYFIMPFLGSRRGGGGEIKASIFFLHQLWIKGIVGIIIDINTCISTSFALNITVLCGLRVIDAFESLCEEFDENYLTDSANLVAWTFPSELGLKMQMRKKIIGAVHPIPSEKFLTLTESMELFSSGKQRQRLESSGSRSALEDMHQRFVAMRRLFKDFNDFTGYYSLVLVMQTSFLVIFFAYNITTGGTGIPRYMVFLPFAVSFLAMITLPFAGSYMQIKVDEWKEKLEDHFLKNKFTDPCQKVQVKRIVESMTLWKWSMTSRDFFAVDNSLLPAIAGALLTYIIFLFQLKMSEVASPSSRQPQTAIVDIIGSSNITGT